MMPAQRKPTALKVYKGKIGDLALTGEPTYSSEDVAAPEELSDDAMVYWNHYAPQLSEQGLLTNVDVPLFGDFCTWLAISKQITLELRDADDLAIKDGRGSLKKHPGVTQKRQATEMVMKLSERFGFSPSDRAKFNKGSYDYTLDLSGDDDDEASL